MTYTSREACSKCGAPLEPGKLLPPDYVGSAFTSPVAPTPAQELICPFCGTKNK